MSLPPGHFDALTAPKQRRSGTPEQVTGAALFFARDRSGFCAGSGLILDGGLDAALI